LNKAKTLIAIIKTSVKKVKKSTNSATPANAVSELLVAAASQTVQLATLPTNQVEENDDDEGEDDDEDEEEDEEKYESEGSNENL
jgi:hypothetical protein